MINLKDKLSHLTFREACKLLGPEGGRLIREGGKYDVDIDGQRGWLGKKRSQPQEASYWARPLPLSARCFRKKKRRKKPFI